MNSFEAFARAKKVAAMLAALPPVVNEQEALALSAVLAGWTQEQRNCWARHCGVSKPSATTWDQLVQEARGRKPLDVDGVREEQSRRSA